MNKGYKVLDLDMTPLNGDDSMIYELGKVYEMPEEELNICHVGYHYYKELKDIIDFYTFDTSENRIFEVEVLGKEVTDGTRKYCTNKIRLVRELSQEEIIKYIEDHLDEFVKSKWQLRHELALCGYCLNILVHDEEWFVRKAVAQQGYGLDILVNDEEYIVRAAVAEQGYGLDILIHDESFFVRNTALQEINKRLKIGDKNE